MRVRKSLPRTARDGVFFRSIAAVHPRYGTPTRAIALQAVLASLLVSTGSFDQIIAYFIFVAVLFIGITVAGLPLLPRKAQSAEWGLTRQMVAASIIFLALVLVLLLLLAWQDPKESLLGTAVVAMGIPFYQILKVGPKRSEAIGNLPD